MVPYIMKIKIRTPAVRLNKFVETDVLQAVCVIVQPRAVRVVCRH